MIAPHQDGEIRLEPGYLEDAARDFFQPGGALEAAIGDHRFPYEFRPPQLAMSEAVARVLEGQQHLAVEAGTGVGKSLAYLVPLVTAAVLGDTQAVVSTFTISLQEQLLYKDLPLLHEHLDLPFRAALVKGMGNYLCLRRLARAEGAGGDLFRPEQERELRMLREWSSQTTEGSLQDLKMQPGGDVWESVCVEPGNCLWQKCPEYAACRFMEARREAQQAHLLIVNHHLLFTDLSIRIRGGGMLPPFKMAVIDEAHQAEAVASEHLGVRVSQPMVERWLRRLCTRDGRKGLFPLIRHGAGARDALTAWDETADFFGQVADWAALQGRANQRVVEEPIPVETRLPASLQRLYDYLKQAAEEIEDNEDRRAELLSAQRRGADLLNMLEHFLGQTLEDQVYWVERSSTKRPYFTLLSAPISVASMLRDTLFGGLDSVVLTSATLSVRGSLDYVRGRLGAEATEPLQVGSPFDYARQMRILLPRGMPPPSDTQRFPGAVARAVRFLARRTDGHAFVLFTSDALMRDVAGRLESFFRAQQMPLLVQGTGMPRHAMLEAFRETPRGVLFGLDSFWTGVDVRGGALRNVMITRLPFAVPDQPVIRARMDRIRENGGDPFKEYALPEAVLKLRQGVGRLIRTAQDEGIIAILDERVQSKWYGRAFLGSLPECPVEQVDLPDEEEEPA